jgi:AraC family transcriptional regulator
VRDPVIREIACALKVEIQGGRPGGRLYGETLANTLAMHVVHKHTAHPVRVRAKRGGLPRHVLRRVLDYIHDKALEPVSLLDLANIAGLSPFYFTRLFKESLAEPPYQYVLRCRIQRGAQMLLAPGVSIATVATQTGFSDQSHFASHFKRFYGVSPAVYVRSRRA